MLGFTEVCLPAVHLSEVHLSAVHLSVFQQFIFQKFTFQQSIFQPAKLFWCSSVVFLLDYLLEDHLLDDLTASLADFSSQPGE